MSQIRNGRRGPRSPDRPPAGLSWSMTDSISRTSSTRWRWVAGLNAERHQHRRGAVGARCSGPAADWFRRRPPDEPAPRPGRSAEATGQGQGSGARVEEHHPPQRSIMRSSWRAEPSRAIPPIEWPTRMASRVSPGPEHRGDVVRDRLERDAPRNSTVERPWPRMSHARPGSNIRQRVELRPTPTTATSHRASAAEVGPGQSSDDVREAPGPRCDRAVHDIGRRGRRASLAGRSRADPPGRHHGCGPRRCGGRTGPDRHPSHRAEPRSSHGAAAVGRSRSPVGLPAMAASTSGRKAPVLTPQSEDFPAGTRTSSTRRELADNGPVAARW